MLNIRLEGKLPIYEQLYNGISRLIFSAKQFGINPNTVQKSYSQLEQAGLIYSIPAKGSYVSGGGDAAEAVRKEAVRKAGCELRSAYDAGVSLAEIESLARQIWSGEAGEAGETGETGERTGGNQ